MLTAIEKCISGIVFIGLYLSCRGQADWPKERGLIMTTFDTYGYFWRGNVQMRHLPIYPGYESFSAAIPGINFTNPHIHFQSVDVDYRTQCVYMYDKYLRTIVIGTGYNAAMETKNMTFKRMHGGVSTGPAQVAVDWLSHTVYWSDSVFRWIIAAPGQTDKIEYDYYKIIVDTHLEAPSGIAVDPLEGYLFWSDNGKHPKIERSDLNGENRHTIISKHLKSPLSIGADVGDKRIYWIDESSVLSATYEGKDVISVRRIPESSLFDLATFREVVYVSDIQQRSIYTLKTAKGPELGRQQSSTIQLPSETVYGLAVYGAENQPLKDKDYCAENSCDHMCITTRNGSQCVCSEGYVWNEETGKCNETTASFHRAIVVANATHVCLADIRAFADMSYEYVCRYTTLKKKQAWSQYSTSTEQTHTVTHGTTTKVDYTTSIPHAEPVHNLTRIALDMKNRVLFFATTENVMYKRPIDLPIENEAIDWLVEATGNISGLAYDAGDSNNLYWCEYDTGSLWVVNVGTKAAKNITVDNGGLSKPRNIAVILKHRVLAVITADGSYESIVTVTMEGDDKTVVAKAYNGITSFTFDSEYDKFYYISWRYLYSTMYNGSAPERVLYLGDTYSNNLIKYQHYLTWVFQYPRGSGDFYLRVYRADTLRQVTQGMFNDTSIFIVDMKVLDVKLQSSNITNPCSVFNGGCSQICITKYVNDTMTPICECRFGYLLSDDGYTCSTAAFVEDNFLIAVDLTNNELVQVNLETDETTVFPDMQNGYYYGVYFDPQTKRVLWTERSDKNIYSANLNGTDRQILSDFDYIGYSYRFDKDLTTRNLYFISWYFIGVIIPNGEVLELKRIDSWRDIGDIVVHPGKGWCYITSSGYRSKYVGRLDMDGENFVELITGDHVDKPLGLAIDFINEHLYWSDATFDTIQRCNLDGEDCVTILNMTGTYLQEEIRDLQTDGEFLYYSAFRIDHIVRVDLKEPYTRKVLGQTPGIGKLDVITFYSSKSENIQPESKDCSGQNGLGDCSTICLPNPRGRTCACENDIPLKEDGRTCVNIFQCTDIIEQTVPLSPGKKQVLEVTFSRSCLRKLDEKCHYRCPKHYLPIYDTLLTCTNVGWTLESETLCREIRCPEKIENGYIDSSCEREVGATCNYSCNDGFEKTTDAAICVENGTYHIPDDGLCAPFKCSAEIENGTLDEKCARELGDTCNYSCNKYYSKNSESLQITCQRDGWSSNTNLLCKESVCTDISLTNGIVTADCQKKVGNMCTVSCDKGYINTTTYAVCNDDLMWHPKDACKPVKCPPVLQNGHISGTCKFAVGSTCNFTCDDGYKENSIYRNVTCNMSGQWNVRPCTEISCSPTIMNGKLSPDCDGTIGEKCSFVCNEGFIPTTASVVCTENGTYHVPEEELCSPFKCTDKIDNGALVDGCSRTIGSTCNYVCNKYFSPSVANNEILCQADGWSRNSTDLCKVSVCSESSLRNTKIVDNCMKKVGETCMFKCNPGYTNTTDVAICTSDGTWQPREPCLAVKCTALIPNGEITGECSHEVGAICSFMCHDGFTRNGVQQMITCKSNGQWDRTDFCLASTCEDSSLYNGRLVGNCLKRAGDACEFQCINGYTNTTDTIVCKTDNKWYPVDACIQNSCQPFIQNGNITGSCDYKIGSLCNFTCNEGFSAVDRRTQVRCNMAGHWDIPDNLCYAQTGVSERVQNNVLSVAGVASGIVVLCIVIIALTVALIIMIRRKASGRSMSGSSDARSGGTAIENPGYLRYNDPSYPVRQEEPSTSDDSTQMQTIFSGEATLADERINQVNNMEPLPDVAQLELTDDRIALTNDSWLNEREKKNCSHE